MKFLAILGLGAAAVLNAQPMDRVATVKMFDAWKAPVPPRHLIGNLYYVGAIGVSSYLITTSEGHVILDSGFEDTVPIIARGVEELGFKLSDVKLILSSHAHIDHTGGHAALQRMTGAKVIASEADARVLESGGREDFIPMPKDLVSYEPVKVDAVVQDGETVEMGGVKLTAHVTPGHTRGATTWTMEVEDGGRTYRVLFFSSASINPGTRLTGAEAAYPGIADDLEGTFARLKAMTCDIFLAPHGGQFAMAEKFARLEKGEPAAQVLVDPEGWRAAVEGQERAFRGALAAERAEDRRTK